MRRAADRADRWQAEERRGDSRAPNNWSAEVGLTDAEHEHSLADRFYLDPRDYMRADRAARAQGLDIVGCYHSHPDHPAIPSERDRVGAQGVGGGSSFSFLIQSVRRARRPS